MKFHRQTVTALLLAAAMVPVQTYAADTDQTVTVYYDYDDNGQEEAKKAGKLTFTCLDEDHKDTDETHTISVTELQSWVMKNRPKKGWQPDLDAIAFKKNGKETSISEKDTEIKLKSDTLYIDAEKDDSYDVYFYTEPGKLYDTETIKKEDELKMPKDPTRKGYEFEGWNIDEPIDGTSYIYAKWKAKSAKDSTQYDVTFSYLDKKGKTATTVDTVNEGAVPEAPELPEVSGKQFIGWDKKLEPAAGDITYTAVYEDTTYAVTFHYLDANGKEVSSTEDVKENEMPAAPDLPEVQGKEFTGWKPELTEAVADAEYTAKYEDAAPDIEYTITFNYLDEDGQPASEKQTVAESEMPQAPEINSEDFIGWDPEITEATANAVYTARYKETEKYTIRFDYLDADGKPTSTTMTVDEGQTPTAPELPEIADKRFVGWDAEITSAKSDTVYTAKYADIYTITYEYLDENGKTVSKEFKAEKGEATPEFKWPDVKGYTFEGWEPAVSETVTGNAVYKAKTKKVEKTEVSIQVRYLEQGTDKELHFPYRVVVEQGDTYDVSNFDKVTIKGYNYVETKGALTGTAEKDTEVTVWYKADKPEAVKENKPADGANTSTQTNSGLYIGLGVAAIVVVACLLIFGRKKK